jgi:hypothetical protein
MLRKVNEVKWIAEDWDSFDQIKHALTESLVLINPNYSKDFFIFSFSSFETLVLVLIQKNTEGLEHPISFFSRALRDAEMRYDIMEKKAYTLAKCWITERGGESVIENLIHFNHIIQVLYQ